MGKVGFVAGALGIVVGFFVYQYGFFMTLNLSPILFTWSEALLPWVRSREVTGAVLQIVGGGPEEPVRLESMKKNVHPVAKPSSLFKAK